MYLAAALDPRRGEGKPDERDTLEAAVGFALLAQGIADLHAIRQMLEAHPKG